MLHHYGVTGHTNKRIETESFLSSRQQAVAVEGTKSGFVSVWFTD